MKNFILWLLPIYAILSIAIVATLIITSENEKRERRFPRKQLYVVNLSNDSIAVSISGSYDKYEKKEMKDKPDTYTISGDTIVMPYNWYEEQIRQAATFRLPHKHNKKIKFPRDFRIHVKSPQREFDLDRSAIYGGDDTEKNWWVVYIHPHPTITEKETSTIFVADGVRYTHLLTPLGDELAVLRGKRAYEGKIFIPYIVEHDGKPYRVTAFADETFSYCNNIFSFDYPNSIRHFGNSVFKFNSGLREIRLPDSLISIGDEAFSMCINIQAFTFPSTLESIGKQAFENCWGITSVTIPPLVSSIRSGTFSGCRSLTHLKIPQKVKTIESGAFYGCEALVHVEVEWRNPLEIKIDDTCFSNVILNRVTLVVPVGTRHLYLEAPIWKEFGNIVEKTE